MEGYVRNVLLVDDHLIIRNGLREILRRDPRYRVIGECGDGCEALKLICNLQPDVLILDLNIHGRDGFDILRRSRLKYPKLRTIVLTIYKNVYYYREAYELGANAYLTKDEVVDELLICLEKVFREGIYYSPYLEFQNACTRENLLFTPRETQLIKGIAEGKSNHELADLMFCSVKNIEKLKSKLREKIGIGSSPNALTAWSIKNYMTFLPRTLNESRSTHEDSEEYNFGQGSFTSLV